MQPDAWNDYSAQNKSDAEMEMAKSQHLREAIFNLIEQTNNDLAVQIDQTNFDFRKRIYEMKRAKEELEYQMRKVCIVTLDKKRKISFNMRPLRILRSIR